MADSAATSEELLHFLAQHGFAHLPARDKVAVARVCTAWRRACSCTAVWQELDLRGASSPSAWLAQYEAAAEARCAGSLVWTSLNAEFCALKNADLAVLPSSLTAVNLNGCREIDDGGIDILTQRCPLLTRIELYWNTRVTSKSVTNIATRCGGVSHLNLSGCKLIEDDGVVALARKGGGSLTFLDLTRCPKLTDNSLQAICRANPCIVTLNLYATVSVTDISCVAIGQSLPHLQRLDLCGAAHVTDAGIMAVAGGCPALRFLGLTWVVQLTDAALEPIANLARLALLSLFGIRGLTDAGLAKLAAGACAGSLRTLDINGCCGIASCRDRARLQLLFPHVTTWIVHS